MRQARSEEWGACAALIDESTNLIPGPDLSPLIDLLLDDKKYVTFAAEHDLITSATPVFFKSYLLSHVKAFVKELGSKNKGKI
jgi:hypothetical protein